MKCSSESALAGDEVRPAFENLRWETRRHGPRLIRERTSHIKSPRGIPAGNDLDRANGLCSYLLCGVKGILGSGGAGLDLRYIKVTGKSVLLLYIGEF